MNVLPFLLINATNGVETLEVGHFDDGVSHAIYVPHGFLFGNALHNIIFVSCEAIPIFKNASTKFVRQTDTC